MYPDHGTGKSIKSNLYVEVSWNGGTPRPFILIGCSIINHPFGGTPISGNLMKPPCMCSGTVIDEWVPLSAFPLLSWSDLVRQLQPWRISCGLQILTKSSWPDDSDLDECWVSYRVLYWLLLTWYGGFPKLGVPPNHPLGFSMKSTIWKPMMETDVILWALWFLVISGSNGRFLKWGSPKMDGL